MAAVRFGSVRFACRRFSQFARFTSSHGLQEQMAVRDSRFALFARQDGSRGSQENVVRRKSWCPPSVSLRLPPVSLLSPSCLPPCLPPVSASWLFGSLSFRRFADRIEWFRSVRKESGSRGLHSSQTHGLRGLQEQWFERFARTNVLRGLWFANAAVNC